MILSYFKDGMYTMTEIKSQNERVTESLNNSQSTFIQYLERADDKQVKVNEFVQSFNKFSDEFPDLRKDE
jgi:phage protein U